MKNFLDGTIAGDGRVRVGSHMLMASFSDRSLREGQAVTVAVRPDAFRRGQGLVSEGTLVGRISLVAFLGTGYEYLISLDPDVSLAVQTGERLGDRDDQVTLEMKRGAAVAFPKDIQ
jgi:hypothetical protein